MEAAPVEIVRVEPSTAIVPRPKPGVQSSEFWGGVVAADVLAVLGTVGDWLPSAWRWVPLAGTLIVKAAYVVIRGIAKRPVVAK